MGQVGISARGLHGLRAVPLLLLGGCTMFHSRAPTCAAGGTEVFAPGVISGGEKDAFGAFSPDGSEFYFTRFSVGRDRSAILVSRQQDGTWMPPDTLPVSGRYADREPFMSPDGRWLFFVSDRPHPEKLDPSYDLWVVEHQTPRGWGTPRRLPAPINSTTSEASPVVTRNGTLYFASGRPGGQGGMDLYRVLRSGNGYGVPENLGAVVSTEDSELGLYVSPDERVMVIARSSRGRWGRAGPPDLSISVRRRGQWEESRPVGPPVNSDAHEFGPTLSPDGTRLYFSRDVTQNFIRDLDAGMDIHSAHACVLTDDRVVRRALDRTRRSSMQQ